MIASGGRAEENRKVPYQEDEKEGEAAGEGMVRGATGQETKEGEAGGVMGGGRRGGEVRGRCARGREGRRRSDSAVVVLGRSSSSSSSSNPGLRRHLQGRELVLKVFVRHPHHDVAKHVEEAAVRVVGEAGSGLLRKPLHHLVVEPQVQNCVHHARHGDLRGFPGAQGKAIAWEGAAGGLRTLGASATVLPVLVMLLLKGLVMVLVCACVRGGRGALERRGATLPVAACHDGVREGVGASLGRGGGTKGPTAAPERTESSSGLEASPNFAPISFSISSRPCMMSSHTPSGSCEPGVAGQEAGLSDTPHNQHRQRHRQLSVRD